MIGQTISHYKILDKLGEGGMGVVYKARDTKLDRDVALKFLPHYLTTDPAEKERFFHEARAAGSLTHQNIAVVYEIGEHQGAPEIPGQLFIAMEYVAGETLKKIVGSGVLSIRQVLDIGIQISEGLAAAHEKGIVHRDIKSDNIIHTPRGQVKIMDFGLAKVKGATKLTKTGSTLGTAAYMSPEQARGEEVDHRSDIFSFGVVLYELLTAHLPFRGEHPTALMYSIVNEEPQPLARFNEKITPEIERIIAKMLAKERDERYQHADEILADLRHERKMLEYARTGYTRATEPIATAPPQRQGVPDPSSRTRPSMRILSIIGAAVVLVAVFFLLRPFLFEEVGSTERRSVAVISFLNQTGDESYDYLQDAIPNLLITNLEQSQYLHVTTWERLTDLLKQTGMKGTTFIDRDLGFELCAMDDIEAIVLGSFTKAGNVFAMDVKVIDVRTKDLLKSANSRGDGVGSILKTQIDELSTDISRGIGLSEPKINSAPMKIIDRTTTSMEAYNYFLRGVADLHKWYFKDAEKFLKKAINIDSTFAIAHGVLAAAYRGLNDEKASTAAIRQAVRYGQKAPERERMMIAASFATMVEKNSDHAKTILKEVTQKFPKQKMAHYYLGQLYHQQDSTSAAIAELEIALRLDPEFGPALNQLGYVYASLGEYDKAIEFFHRYAAVNPGDANPMDSLAEIFAKMGRLDDAIAKFREALELRPGFAMTNLRLAYLLFLKEQFSGAMACVDKFITDAPSPGIIAEGYVVRSIFNYYCLGKHRQANRDLNRAEEIFKEIGNKRNLGSVHLLRGWIQFDRHETDAGLRSLSEYFGYPSRAYPGEMTGFRSFAFALLALQKGDVRGARSRLEELNDEVKNSDSSLLGHAPYRRDLVWSRILAQEDSIDEAIRVLESSRLPSAMPNIETERMIWYNVPFTRDIVAQLYLRKGDVDRAISEYEKIMTFDPDAHDWRLILPTYHYRLAQLLEQQGDSGRAVREYDTFLRFWKDADPDLPQLKDARTRLSNLKR